MYENVDYIRTVNTVYILFYAVYTHFYKIYLFNSNEIKL